MSSSSSSIAGGIVSKPERPPSKLPSTTTSSASSVAGGGGGHIKSNQSSDTSIITTGNVAAYRKSLEIKTLHTTVSDPIVGSVGGGGGGMIEKPNRKSFDAKTNDFRKSLENLDEKSSKGTVAAAAPPLSKKPSIPTKKSPTVTNVTSSLFSGLKQKVRSDSGRTSSSNDSLDGIGTSKTQVADNQERSIVGERIKHESLDDFDRIERGTSILPDMRATRVKAPKRRLPTAASMNVDNDGDPTTTYQNGGSGSSNGDLDSDARNESFEEDGGGGSGGSGRTAKPRNWERQRAPWMDELKASQAKKTVEKTDTNEISNEKFDMSKSFSSSHVLSSSSSSSMSSTMSSSQLLQKKVASDISNFELRSNSFDVNKSYESAMATVSNISSASSTPSNNVQMTVARTTTSAKSMTNVESSAGPIGPIDNTKVRPSSVNLNMRNRSISPMGRTSFKSMQPSVAAAASAAAAPTSPHAIESPKNHQLHYHQHTDSLPPIAQQPPITTENVCQRVQDLEAKVAKLERLVITQNSTIEELLKNVKVEAEKVKTLKGELDKYAQCVTQV